jgi:hypothetical protein
VVIRNPWVEVSYSIQQYVGLTADLAVFNVALPTSRGLIHGGGIPLAAAGTLKARFHEAIISTAGLKNA